MKLAIRLAFVFLLASAIPGYAQLNCENQTTRSCIHNVTITTSGTTVRIPNNGGLVPSFEELITGAPSTVSIVILGCGMQNTCDTLDTYTTVANSVRAPTIAKYYDHYYATASWTGGTAVAVQIVAEITSARFAPGAGGGGASFSSTPGFVYNTSSTASGNATQAQLLTLLGSAAIPGNAGGVTGQTFGTAASAATTGGGTAVATVASTTTTSGDAVKYNNTTGELADAGGAAALTNASNTFANASGQIICALTNNSSATSACLNFQNSSYQNWDLGVRGYGLEFYNTSLTADYIWFGAYTTMASGSGLTWGSSTSAYTNAVTRGNSDTGVGRSAAGVVSADTTTTGNGLGKFTAVAYLPTTLYSAAGTAIPTCAVGLKGEIAVVSDATSPTYMGAYTSGGGITTAVICSFNGTTYAWLTH